MRCQLRIGRHQHLGLNAAVALAAPGDVSSASPAPSSGHGLSTSIGLAGAALACLGAADANNDVAVVANGMFDALANLTAASSGPAPARTLYVGSEAPPPDPQGYVWFKSTQQAVPGGNSSQALWYMGNASASDVAGHLFALPVFVELVATPAGDGARAEAANGVVCALVEEH